MIFSKISMNTIQSCSTIHVFHNSLKTQKLIYKIIYNIHCFSLWRHELCYYVLVKFQPLVEKKWPKYIKISWEGMCVGGGNMTES